MRDHAFYTDNREKRSRMAVGLAILSFIAFNILVNALPPSWRADLTQDGLYTHSSGITEIIESIQEPITLRLFLSRRLTDQSASGANYANRVRDILTYYERISDGAIRLEIFDPEPYSLEEDRAVTHGMRGIPLTDTGEKAYFGLAGINSTDDEEVIAFFDPAREPFIEYDIAQLIYQLTSPPKQVIGLFSSFPLGADPAKNFQPWILDQVLRQFFDIRSLRTDLKSIERDEIDILLLAHPDKLRRDQLYAIDQFILRGGRALIFLDPHSETAAAAALRTAQQQSRSQGRLGGFEPPDPDASSNLEPLLESWGIGFDHRKVVADLGSANRVSMGPGGRLVDHIAWLALDADNIAPQDITTGELNHVNMATTGSFSHDPAKGTTVEPLLFSSRQAMEIPVENVQGRLDPNQLLDHFEPENRIFPLAVRLSGIVESAFRDSESRADFVQSDNFIHLDQAQEPVNVILVADTDLLSDRFWAREQNFMGQSIITPFANNGDFVVNALENLSGNNALLSLRGRGLSSRSFERIEDIRKQAELRYREKRNQLIEKLRDAEEQLAGLQTQQDNQGAISLTQEEAATLQSLQENILVLRRQLREVQHELRKDVETLDTWLKMINIWAVPFLISLIALALIIHRRRLLQQFDAALNRKAS